MTKKTANKARLNDLIIRRLKAKDAPYLIWDTVQRGLVKRVEPSGYRSYKVIYNRFGRTRWYTIGPVDVIMTNKQNERPAPSANCPISTVSIRRA
jgi:hypothetical protein